MKARLVSHNARVNSGRMGTLLEARVRNVMRAHTVTNCPQRTAANPAIPRWGIGPTVVQLHVTHAEPGHIMMVQHAKIVRRAHTPICILRRVAIGQHPATEITNMSHRVPVQPVTENVHVPTGTMSP